MEEVLLRFPHLGEKILLSLDYQSLIKCRMVARHWKESMEVENSKYIRLIKHYTDCSDELLKNVLKKSGGAILMVSVLREIFWLFPRRTKQRRVKSIECVQTDFSKCKILIMLKQVIKLK